MPNRLAVATSNAMVDAYVARIDAGPSGGTVKVYTGAQPATPADAATGTLLLTFTFDPVSFGAAANRTAALDASPVLTAVGAAAGTAGWARIADSTGAVVSDHEVSATGGSGMLQLSTTTVSVGLDVELTAGSITQPM